MTKKHNYWSLRYLNLQLALAFKKILRKYSSICIKHFQYVNLEEHWKTWLCIPVNDTNKQLPHLQRKRKRSAFTLFTADTNRLMMCLDDVLYNGQSKP